MYRVALNVGISHLRGQSLRRQHAAVPLDDSLTGGSLRKAIAQLEELGRFERD